MIPRNYFWRESISRELNSILLTHRELRAVDSATAAFFAQSSYIRALSNIEWNDWRDYMGVLIEGVNNGYIPDTEPRFLRDPSGVCGGRY
jgi:hypothetical protein